MSLGEGADLKERTDKSSAPPAVIVTAGRGGWLLVGGLLLTLGAYAVQVVLARLY